MEHIISSKLKHNPEAIKTCFRINNNMTIVTKNVRIVFLASYLDKFLADINDYVTLVGIYGILDEDGNYATCIAPIQQKLLVSRITDATCDDGRLYKILYIEKDNIMIDNNNLVINDNQVYYIYDQFFVKGIIPFYITYDQLPSLLAESDIYNHTNVGKDRHVFEILTSLIARGKDKNVYYRNSPDAGVKKPTYVSLGNIYYSLKSTSSKIIGGYYGTGISVAALHHEEETTSLEKILMGKG